MPPHVLRLVHPGAQTRAGETCYSVEQIEKLASEGAHVAVMMDDGRSATGTMLGLRDDDKINLYLGIGDSVVSVGPYWRAVGIFRIGRSPRS